MAAPSSHLQQGLHVSSMKPSSTSSPTYSSSSSPTTLSSMKLKSLIQTLILSHVCRVARALSRAKSILVQILKEHHHLIHYLQAHPPRSPRRKNKNLNKIFFGSFRLHYNWCSSSHVLPVPAPVLLERLSTNCHEDSEAWRSASLSAREPRQLSGYLQWLEEKEDRPDVMTSDGSDGPPQEINEIDQLADMFIAGFHEKFRLEKQESYRRFQEMLARSM